MVPVVNLAGVKSGELQLTGELLADIYARKIKMWNDPRLLATNPRVALPASAIVVLARSDGSGTTYNFSDYLSRVSPAWKHDYGRNFTIAWAEQIVAAKGSSGMVTALKQTPGAIGYVDFSYVVQDKLAYAQGAQRRRQVRRAVGPGFAAALENSAWQTAAPSRKC